MYTVDILYSYYFNPNGQGIKIGGIQTYITNLCKVIESLNYKIRIFQYADVSFNVKISDVTEVIGVPVKGNLSKKVNSLYKAVTDSRKGGKYLTIFATDTIIPDCECPNSIAIQHGVMWDHKRTTPSPFIKDFLGKTYRAYQTLRRVNKVNAVVCVDNNFICWYRTQTGLRRVKLIPIMNFARVLPKTERTEHRDIKLVFARRFETYRGTRIFAEVIEKLFSDYTDISVTFAGEGPDEAYLKNMFADDNRVKFTRYLANESLDFHKNFDIAVVPTTGSEGTSLSLLEAMSAGCAVVCTNVGGMTNIILDGYNGLMVSAGDVNELYEAIKSLIDDVSKRKSIAENGYETVRCAFSYERWEHKWSEVLTEMLS